MHKGLSSNRTGYNSSASLYGGDISVDADLESYFTSGAGKQNSNKKKKGQKNKHESSAAAASSSQPQSNKQQQQPSKKSKKMHTPNGFQNLGYGLIEESSSLVFSTTKVQGVSTNLEKDYLRLTSAADPANVRSPAVLQAALTMVKRKWIDTADYEYSCNQLKSIRQDCTVQHLRNVFTVEVYETHARIALESGDFQEFAQSQTQLQLLYKDGHTKGFEHECEFAAYKILYSCLMTGPSDSGLVSFINSLDDAHRSQAAVSHALSVRSALLTTNFHLFFQLWTAAPNMSAYLMDPLADGMRGRSARILVAAYRPRLALEDVTRKLAFGREEEEGLSADSERVPSLAAQRKCKEYLEQKFEGMFVWVSEPQQGGPNKLYIDCKVTHDRLTPSNAAHRLPINSARARHTVSASNGATAAAAASPAHAPIAAASDVGMWIKKGSTGKVQLGRLEGSPPPSLSLSGGGQPRPFRLSSPSPSLSPSPPPAAADAMLLDDPVSRKRRNSQPLSSMSYADLKSAVDELEATLTEPGVAQKYDAFNLSLMMTRLRAMQKQLKKTKKTK
jgi:hypothetical protein